MKLETLSLLNYKNFEDQTFNFDSKINCLVGNNGVGKTNVLDAIYHLSFGKSYFNPISSQNIKHNQDFFVLEGVYKKNDKKEKILISLKKGQKKIIKRNNKAYDRFSKHIGFLPLVIISPTDRNLITEGSDVRRKFIDAVISQGDHNYLNDVITYHKIISQRNALLKYFALNSTFNETTLEAYNQQMISLGETIYNKRKAFIDAFIPVFKSCYKIISNNNEEVAVIYKSDLFDNNFEKILHASILRDRQLQYSSVGIHKDDLNFLINGSPIKKFGSQGQQKSFLIALKLAQFECIKLQQEVNPILLLDDVFDKLDETRVKQIITLVGQEKFGQIFISDTHAERTEHVVKQIHQTYKIFKL